MLTKSILLINLLGMLVFGTLLPGELHVTQNTPAIMTAGEEVKVTVTVEKGDLTGFAKLQIDLPDGLSATSIETKGASFTFSEGKAKFIWMSLPASPKFMVSYTLKADPTASGSYPINGKLSYIEDNERKTHDMSTSIVQVTGGAAAQAPPATAPSSAEPAAATSTEATAQTLPATTPVNDASNDVVSAAGAAPISATVPALPPPGPRMIAPQQGAGSVGCTRTITPITETEMVVEVTISKGSLRGFGKLQETIPAGFTALEKTSDEAIFTSQGTIVKFVWLNLPAKSELKVTYKLRGNGQPEGDYLVNGEFGYLLNDETQKAVVGSTGFKVGPQAMAQQQTTEPAETTAMAEPVKSEPVVSEPVKTEPIATEPKATAQAEPKPKTTSRIPTPETGVTYKVQIMAAHKEVGPEYFAEVHRYMGAFGIERHEGWIKYVAGRYSAYKEARDQRQAYVSAGHNFPGPFVTAYNNGDRITVQEALMISQQRWVP